MPTFRRIILLPIYGRSMYGEDAGMVPMKFVVQIKGKKERRR
jgi:hypothetical protein